MYVCMYVCMYLMYICIYIYIYVGYNNLDKRINVHPSANISLPCTLGHALVIFKTSPCVYQGEDGGAAVVIIIPVLRSDISTMQCRTSEGCTTPLPTSTLWSSGAARMISRVRRAFGGIEKDWLECSLIYQRLIGKKKARRQRVVIE